MKSPVPNETSKLDDVLGSPKRLLYNRASGRLVVVVSRELDGGLKVRRLFHRHPSEASYCPVGANHVLEDQRDAHSCVETPFVIFNEWRFEEPRQVPAHIQQLAKGKTPQPKGWFANWHAIRRFDLKSGEDKRVLEEENLNPPPPFCRGWVCQIMDVSPDGSSGVCKVGLDGGGMMVRYFIYEVCFTEGLKTMIAELPRVVL